VYCAAGKTLASGVRDQIFVLGRRMPVSILTTTTAKNTLLCRFPASATSRKNGALNPEKQQALIRYLQAEIQRHHWDTFVVDPPSIAAGGKGVLYPGCIACRKIINTTPEYLDHLCKDVIPKLIENKTEKSIGSFILLPSECIRTKKCIFVVSQAEVVIVGSISDGLNAW
jgi:hypothetical protein